MTQPVRQSPSTAVGASPADPITWAVVRRTLLVAGAVGLFLSFVGAFGSYGVPFYLRAPYMVAISWIGALIGTFCFRLATRFAWTRGHRYLQGVVGGLMMTLPMGLIVWGATYALPNDGAPLAVLPGYITVSAVVCQVMTLFAVMMNRNANLIATAAQSSDKGPPKFLDRVPLKLRGAEVWAVEAEDHYLRLHTSKGQDLILLRLADAIDELDGIEGAQVHRSWWVARDAITDAKRGDGRATLTLKDGCEVPVSRTYAKIIRDLGWI